MNQSAINAELLTIERVIASHPAGLGLAALGAALLVEGLQLSRRTLQRRLDTLIQSGRATAAGSGRGVTYAPPDAVQERGGATPAVPAVSEAPQAYPPISTAALAIRDAIRRPLFERPPTGYDRGFLTRYEPNEDFYLSDVQRARLHDLGRTAGEGRPAGTYARDILGRLLIDLSWASSRLEGNTYTRLDTQRLIEHGQAAEGKDARETQMILNHKAAIEMIVESPDDVGFSRFTMFNLHAILSDNLLLDPGAGGRLRQRPVEITGTTFIPLAIPQQIEELFTLLLDKAARIADPFEQAFFGMVHLPYLQPFEDVNKRVSRLAANIPLVRQNLCPLSFVDVPEQAYVEGTLGVYELTRVELLRDLFLFAYERSCQRYRTIRQSLGEPDAFRLKYRLALIDVVSQIVRDNRRGTRDEVAPLAAQIVDAKDVAAFVDAVELDLAHLHEGNIARYRLRRSEYLHWAFKRT